MELMRKLGSYVVFRFFLAVPSHSYTDPVVARTNGIHAADDLALNRIVCDYGLHRFNDLIKRSHTKESILLISHPVDTLFTCADFT